VSVDHEDFENAGQFFTTALRGLSFSEQFSVRLEPEADRRD